MKNRLKSKGCENESHDGTKKDAPTFHLISFESITVNNRLIKIATGVTGATVDPSRLMQQLLV